MAYVDLNPIRACLAKTPEDSSHTSIQKRISAEKYNRQPHPLLSFAGNPRDKIPDGLPFRLEDYLELVELTGRHVHPGKRGEIDDAASPILVRVGLEKADWNEMVAGIETVFTSSVSIEKLKYQRSKNRRHSSG